MNKREAGIYVRKLARQLDSKNAPAVDVDAIKTIVIVCHEYGVKIPKEIDGLWLVKIMRLAIKKGLLVDTLSYNIGEIIMNTTFSNALEALKEGKRVSRIGWNGKGMFLYHVPANEYQAQTEAAKDCFGDMVPYGAYIAIKTSEGNVVPWLASQTDLLSDDWQVLI